MGGKRDKEHTLQFDFSEIVKKAYEKGTSDGTITVKKMIEDLKSDLLQLKAN